VVASPLAAAGFRPAAISRHLRDASLQSPARIIADRSLDSRSGLSLAYSEFRLAALPAAGSTFPAYLFDSIPQLAAGPFGFSLPSSPP
jgi:hypothetical protein